MASLIDPAFNPDELPPALSAWHAEPLGPERAQALLHDAQAQLQAALHHQQGCLACRFRQFIAHYWLGRDVRAEYDQLSKTLGDPVWRALLDLVYGQLLMSRRMTGASDYLRRGFCAAAHYLAAQDYFAVLKRHESLHHLPLSTHATAAYSLEELLKQASVIAQLKRANTKRHSASPPHPSNPEDTAG